MNPPLAPSGAVAGSVLPIRRAEELIATLPGVLSVRIVPNESGAIDEVHVLTTDAVPPKQTVRNIESALIAQLGLRVNHRKVSIATTLDPSRATDVPGSAKAPTTVFVPPATGSASYASSAPQAVPSGMSQGVSSGVSDGGLAAGASMSGATLGVSSGGASGGAPFSPRVAPPRVVGRELGDASRRVLLFEDVELRRSRERGLTCRVTLTRGERAFAGEAKGQSSERSRIDLAARATVLAMAEAFGPGSARTRSLSLEGSQVVEAFGREFVFVSLSAREGRDAVVLTGSCEVQESTETSSVLAVLNATNRWIQLDSL